VNEDPSPACRACGALGLANVLDLGSTPLANSLATTEDAAASQERFPLALAFCGECSLVQITETVPPEKLFRDYLYFSSFSDTMLQHADAITKRLARERGLTRDSLVVELASNDGYLLQYYKQAGIKVLGVEPAANIARVAELERGIPTLCEFFGLDVGIRLRAEGRTADVLHANNVLAHVPDLNGFVAGIAAVLKATGVAVIEVPYVRDMVEHVEFDTIYHEHLCYFSLTALDQLFRRHGLVIHAVERLPIHGGSLRLFASPVSSAPVVGASVEGMLKEESSLGMNRAPYYENFAKRVASLRDSLVSLLATLKRQGKKIAAYGAAAKGSTLLNTFGIGRDVLGFVVDRSTHKQGRYMPGVALPILAPDQLLANQPDYVLLLTWNFADEILEQQAEYRQRGGRFIVPVPEPRIA
jgi:SAM-dependent methyltransferase